MSKPRVTAHHQIQAAPEKRLCGNDYQSPSVTVVVEFTLGDHNYTLSRLEQAVADVRSQIKEASA